LINLISFLPIRSVTTAPNELHAISEPIIFASEIVISISGTSRVSDTFSLIFLESPLHINATLSFVLQNTPTFGFSLKFSR
jgi:hypothetical protein